MVVCLLVLLFLLAFANGANDNSKGVATLVGYGAAKPRQALIYATITTAIGAGFSFFAAGGMIKAFSAGLFAKGTPLSAAFFVAVLIGACGWVLIATRTGLPVSTTHAITGALAGAGLVAFGTGRFQWEFLVEKFAKPLALSPFLSLAIVYLCSWPVVLLANRFGGRCACVTESGVVPAGGGAAAMTEAGVSIRVADAAECAQEPAIAAVSTSGAAFVVFWLTAGLVGFARGRNDCPKIAALGLIALQGSSGMIASFAVVTVAMAIGGLVAGGRVLETLSKKLTVLPLPESLTASAATAVLVSLASWMSWPVSTTHVSTGAIIGAGLRNDPRSVKWGKVGEIALSWVITLPAAAVIAAIAKFLLP